MWRPKKPNTPPPSNPTPPEPENNAGVPPTPGMPPEGTPNPAPQAPFGTQEPQGVKDPFPAPTPPEPVPTPDTTSVPPESVPPVDDDPWKKEEPETTPAPSSSSRVDMAYRPPRKTAPKKILWGLFIGAFLLMAAFYALLLTSFISGNAQNPLFETLGIAEEGLKDTLLVVTNTFFGITALVFLIMALAQIFQWSITDRGVPHRNRYIAKSAIFFFVFVILSGLWVFFYQYISALEARNKNALDNGMIVTNPEIVVGISSPVTIDFSLEDRISSVLDPQYIRQITWDFDGNGSTDASGMKVTHRFIDMGDAGGRFPVTAKVYYLLPGEEQEGVFTSRREVIINNEAIIPNFDMSTDSGTVPLLVEFNASQSRDPDGQVILYEWDFDGDGSYEVRGESANTSHNFTEIGEHKVTLRVTGTNNDFGVMEKVVEVLSPDESLKAEIVSSQGFEGYAPFRITLDGEQSFVREGEITSFLWFIEGEEQPVNVRKIERVFREPGEYRVTLIVENDIGQRSKETRTIRVLEEVVNAKVNIKTLPVARNGVISGSAPLSVEFDASTSTIDNPYEWQWDFDGDGKVDETTAEAAHTFRTPGRKTVTLTIIDSNEDAHTGTVVIDVERSGVKSEIKSIPPAGTVPLKVTFDGSGSFTDKGEIINYKWELPSGQTVYSGAQITYVFREVGVFPVKLTVLTSDGDSDTSEVLVSVRSTMLRADFDIFPISGYAPLEVNFHPGPSRGTIVEYLWDFGDGNTSRKYAPSHTYKQAGEYEIRLEVMDENGLIDEAKKTITVSQ